MAGLQHRAMVGASGRPDHDLNLRLYSQLHQPGGQQRRHHHNPNYACSYTTPPTNGPSGGPVRRELARWFPISITSHRRQCHQGNRTIPHPQGRHAPIYRPQRQSTPVASLYLRSPHQLPHPLRFERKPDHRRFPGQYHHQRLGDHVYGQSLREGQSDASMDLSRARIEQYCGIDAPIMSSGTILYSPRMAQPRRTPFIPSSNWPIPTQAALLPPGLILRWTRAMPSLRRRHGRDADRHRWFAVPINTWWGRIWICTQPPTLQSATASSPKTHAGLEYLPVQRCSNAPTVTGTGVVGAFDLKNQNYSDTNPRRARRS